MDDLRTPFDEGSDAHERAQTIDPRTGQPLPSHETETTINELKQGVDLHEEDEGAQPSTGLIQSKHGQKPSIEGNRSEENPRIP